MSISHVGNSSLQIITLAVILGITLVTQASTTQNTSLFAHRDGCHRYHSCPSDTGSYVCGDLGYDDECPKKSKAKKTDSDKSKKTTKESTKKDDVKPETETDSNSEKSQTEAVVNPSSAIPALEGIEISGPVTHVVDGDTIDLSDSVRIRLALVSTPEEGQEGFNSAKKFVEDLCLSKNGEVDKDNGQWQGTFGSGIGVLYCGGINVNEALMDNSMATISTEFCDVSEFADEGWAASDCSKSSTPTVTETQSTKVSPEVTDVETATQEASGNCDSSYPDFCIPPPPPNLNCPDIPQKGFSVSGSDSHGFDRDNDGVGCES